MSFIVTCPTTAESTNFKEASRVATTADITLSGIQTIDGVLLVDGNRVLVKNQTAAEDNGVYLVHAGAWTRSADMDESPEVIPGMILTVLEGTVNADKTFILTTNAPIVLGTTPLTFALTSAVDHDLLLGLGDDDHLQYFKVTGRTNENLGMAGHILFSSDNVKDIGASGASRPRTIHIGTSAVLPSGGTASAPSINFASATNTGIYNPTSTDYGVSVAGTEALRITTTSATIAGNLLFGTDNTQDIGAAAANRPKDIHLAGILNAGSVVRTATGTAAAPAYSFSAQTNLGMYRESSNSLGFAANGAIRLRIQNTHITSLVPILFPDNTVDIGAAAATRPRSIYVATSVLNAAGTAGAPSYTFEGDPDSGVYNSAADTVAVSTGGTQRLTINTTAATLAGNFIFGADNTYNIGATGASRPGVIYVGTALRSVGGDASTPAYSFDGATSTGMYSSLSNVGISVGASAQLVITSASSTFSGSILFSSDGGLDIGATSANRPNLIFAKTSFLVDPGSNTAPGFAINGDTNTGVYSAGSDTLNFTTGGINRVTIDSSGNATFGGKVMVNATSQVAVGTTVSSGTWGGDAFTTDHNAAFYFGTQALSANVGTYYGQSLRIANTAVSAGSDVILVSANLGSGYAIDRACIAVNGTTAGASTGITPDGPRGNIGVRGAATGDHSGANVGVMGYGISGVASAGGFFTSGFDNKANSKYYGVIGLARNTGSNSKNIGGLFRLEDGTGNGTAGYAPWFPNISGALVASNGTATDPIFIALDNTTEVFKIGDSGTIHTNQVSAAGGLTPATVDNRIPIYDAAGTLLGYIPVYDTL